MNGDPELRIDFWDVGQADCTMLTLPDGRLLLIDVGRKGSPVVDWLNEHRIAPQIEAIILTHNHADHVGALCAIVAEHKRRIGCIWMLADRNLHYLKETAAFRCAEEAERGGFFPLRRLEAGHTIWEDAALGARLHVVHPSFSENVTAGTPNRTSGLIVLEAGGRVQIAWPGDLDIVRVGEKLADTQPWLLHGPHHGAPSDYKHQPARNAITGLAPRRAFVSVGTRNTYHHPRPKYVQLLGRTGCQVVCSELTHRCERERIRRGENVFEGAGALGLRPARSGVTCRGAWRVWLRGGKLVPDQFDALHLERIAKLRRPQCLRGRGWKRGNPLPGPVLE